MKKRIVWWLTGLIILSFGIAMIINSGLGSGSFEAIAIPLGIKFELSTGTIISILNLVIIFIGWIFSKRKANVLMPFIGGILIGPLIDLFAGRMYPFNIYVIGNTEYLAMIIIGVLSVILISFGAMMTIFADLFITPIDFMVSNFSRRLNTSFGKAKKILEVFLIITALIVSLALNDWTQFGIITIIFGIVIAQTLIIVEPIVALMYNRGGRKYD